MMYNLTKQEKKVFDRLDTPQKIQDFLITLPINFERTRETLMSPRLLMKKHKAHCIEGALFAAACLSYHGYEPKLLDLVAHKKDYDHVVCLFRQNGLWGAISKSNHSVLRWRDPIYRSVRELAVSYFHEYFLDDGSKSLFRFSAPFDLGVYDPSWVTADMDLWQIGSDLDGSKHYDILTSGTRSTLRKADKIELKAGKLREWKR